MKKRFALFMGADYYPKGGFCDLKARGRSAERLRRRASRFCHIYPHTWYQVVDLETAKILFSSWQSE